MNFLNLNDKQICDDYLSGQTMKHIAENLKCSSGAIRNRLIKNNINILSMKDKEFILLQKYIKENNYTLLSIYDGALKPITIKCNNDHLWHPQWATIKSNHSKCALCKVYKYTGKYKITDLQTYAKNNHGECLSKEYINGKFKYDWKCENEHIFKKSWTNMINSKSKVFCSKCYSNYVSEETCRSYFESILENQFPKYKAKWLIGLAGRPSELDGYCEKLGIAFEHHGIQHYEPVKHFNKSKSFDDIKKSDLYKEELCKNRGIHLIKINQLFKNTKLCDLEIIIKNIATLYNLKINNNIKINIQTISSKNEKYFNEAKFIIENNGGKLLSEKYFKAKEPLKVVCKNNHSFDTNYNSLKYGKWCKRCHFALKNTNNIDVIDYDINLIKKLYIYEGFKIKEIIDKLNIPEQKMRKISKKYNLFNEKNMYIIDTATQMLKEKISTYEIEEKCHMCITHIKRLINRQHNVNYIHNGITEKDPRGDA